MPFDEELGRRISGLLENDGIVFTEKKMFGGLGFMIGGRMCVGVVKYDLMLRVIDEHNDKVLAMRHVRPMDFTGRPMKGFVYVEPAGFADDASLQKWLLFGIEFGKHGVVKTKAKTK